MNQEEEQKKDNNVVDLSKVFEDFNTKSQNENQLPNQSISPKISKITQWVIKYSGGLIKNKRQAEYILIGIIVLAVVVSLFLVFNSGPKISEKNIFNPETAVPDTDDFIQ